MLLQRILFIVVFIACVCISKLSYSQTEGECVENIRTFMKRFPGEIDVSLVDSVLIDKDYVDSVGEYRGVVRKVNVHLPQIRRVEILDYNESVLFIVIKTSPFGIIAEFTLHEMLVKMEKSSSWIIACPRESAGRIKACYITLARRYGAQIDD